MKTYTLAEIMGNLNDAKDDGTLGKVGISLENAARAVVLALGYPITEEGYADFDRAMTEAGL